MRTLLVVLDQFEDYFLYHPDEDGDGTFADEFPRSSTSPNLRVNFLLSLREDALAKLDRFKGADPAPVRELRPGRAPRPRGRTPGDRGARCDEWNRRLPRTSSPTTLEPALVEAVIDAAAPARLALVRAREAGAPAGRGSAVEAPFLQLVLERLWRATVAAGSPR